MIKTDNSKLDQLIHLFLAEYGSVFQDLTQALDDARMSHYSSACGAQSVSFDLFPASAVVHNLLSLLSLKRDLRTCAPNGLKDYCEDDGYNPGIFFVMYLKRWSGFAQVIMHTEGDSPRGVAAARAKLIMDKLAERLGNFKGALCNENRKKMEHTSPFVRLMEEIGLCVAARTRQKKSEANAQSGNYHKALRAVLGQQAA